MKKSTRLRSVLQFRLPTLFILIAVLASLFTVVSCHRRWIHERKAILSRAYHLARDADTRPPGLLWMFGEIGYSEVCFVRRDQSIPTEAEERIEAAKAAQLFPEATRVYMYYADRGVYRSTK